MTSFKFVLALACVATLFACADVVGAARILAVFPSPSPSHLYIHCAIADALQVAGHNVTVIATMPNVIKTAKYKYLHIKTGTFDAAFATSSVNKPQHASRKLLSFIPTVAGMANKTLAHPDMQQFLREHKENSFDLIILGYLMNDFYAGLTAHFNCPMILSFMVQPLFSIHNLAGNPKELTYVPSLFTGLQQPMNFGARIYNILFGIYENTVLNALLSYDANKYYTYNFPPDRYPPLEEVKKNISLIFTNHHFSQGPIRPLVPALIEIGGIQIKEKPDPLPADIASELNAAKQGAIFFSLGTNVQGSNLAEDKAKIMFNVLSKLPYKVFWKWGDKDFPGTSANIVYKSWLPQDDILAHPNVKLFITHAGQGSVVESQYHGVPMVAIPLFGDQPANAANVVASGFGLSVDYKSLTAEDFRKAITQVIENPKYSNAVKQFAKLYRDRPMTPRQTVVYWVEYVLRYKGAKHLQSPAVHMNTFQLLSLDVIGFLLAVIAVVITIFVKICKLLCCRGKRAAHSEASTKRKKNK